MSSIEELIAKAKAGESESFGQIYEMYREKGIAIARQYVKTAEDAEDMYQDAFIKAMEHIDSFDETKSFGPWLDTIIVNTCKNYLVKKKPTSFTDVSDEEMDFVDTIANSDEDIIPESAYDRKELMEIMDGIIGALPAAQKEAVVLFYYKEMSVKQIAQVQEVPEDTVKSRLNYSRKKVSEGVLEFEKKNGIKIHSTIIVPVLLSLLYKNTARAAAAETAIVSAKAITATGAKTIAQNYAAGQAATATGTTSTGAAATGTAATTAATAATAAAGSGALIAKLAIGGLAALTAVGVATSSSHKDDRREDREDNSFFEKSYEEDYYSNNHSYLDTLFYINDVLYELNEISLGIFDL